MKFRTYEPGSSTVDAREIGRKNYKIQPSAREFVTLTLQIGRIYVAQDCAHLPGYATWADVLSSLNYGRIS